MIELSLNPADSELTLREDGALIRRSILPGGVRVLTEKFSGVHTAAVGMWVGAGSADEDTDALGSTHFLEHLLFKGTRTRTAKQIAERIDFLGGNVNAGTGKQLTYYYGHVVEEDIEPLVGLLASMITTCTLAESDMEMERGVILEELAMYNDDASEVAHESLASLVFGDHPLGRPIGGTRETVTGLAHDSLTRHYASNYKPSELVISAAGNVDHDALCAMVLRHLTQAGWELAEGAAPAPRRRRETISYPGSQNLTIERPVEQSAVIVGMPAMTDEDPRRYALYTLSTILGGGTSSRLFQEVREKRGLAYSTYSFPGLYHEGGLFGLYAGCNPNDADSVAELMVRCLEEITEGGVTNAERETAYRRARADHTFGSESVGSRMNQLGQAEIIRGTLLSREESLRRSREVSGEDIRQVAAELMNAPHSRVIVGPAGESV